MLIQCENQRHQQSVGRKGVTGLHSYSAFNSLISAARFTRRPARAAATIAVAALLPAVAGCGFSSSDSKAKPLNVVATTRQMGDIAQQIGGDATKVTMMLPEGTDPHGYQPTASDTDALQRSALVIRAGGDLDSWLEPALRNVSKPPRIVNLSKSVKLMRRSDGRANNAHWQMDVSNLALAAAAVRDALTKANPSAGDTYRSNAANYIRRANEIDNTLKICAGSLPVKKRLVIADHDDFDYMAKAYGFKIVAHVRQNAERPSTSSGIRKATAAGKAGKAKAVFTSWGQIDPGAGQVSLKLDIPKLALFSDALGPSGQGATTALDAAAVSVKQAVESLSGSTSSCTIPE